MKLKPLMDYIVKDIFFNLLHTSPMSQTILHVFEHPLLQEFHRRGFDLRWATLRGHNVGADVRPLCATLIARLALDFLFIFRSFAKGSSYWRLALASSLRQNDIKSKKSN